MNSNFISIEFKSIIQEIANLTLVINKNFLELDQNKKLLIVKDFFTTFNMNSLGIKLVNNNLDTIVNSFAFTMFILQLHKKFYYDLHENSFLELESFFETDNLKNLGFQLIYEKISKLFEKYNIEDNSNLTFEQTVISFYEFYISIIDKK